MTKMEDPKEYYRMRAKQIKKGTPNLLFVLSNKNNRINYKDLELTPQAFAETFLIKSGGCGFPGKTTNIEGYIKNEVASKKINDEWFNDMFNPIKDIIAKKEGISLGINMIARMYQFQNKDKQNGYIFYISDHQLSMLLETGIEYIINHDRFEYK